MTDKKKRLSTTQVLIVAVVCVLFAIYHFERMRYWSERHADSLTLRHGAILGSFLLIALGQVGAALSSIGRPGSALARFRDLIATPSLILLGLTLMAAGAVGIMGTAWLDVRFCIFAFIAVVGFILLRNVFTVRDD
jgi:hypothetical protein